MQTPSTTTLDYHVPAARVEKTQGTTGGFALGWSAGIVVGIVTSSALVGPATTPIWVVACGGMAIGLLAYGLARLLRPFRRGGPWAAFVLSLLVAVVVAYTLPYVILVIYVIVALSRGERIVG